MTVTKTLLRVIADCERSTGEKPTELHMTESSFLRLKAEVASGCLVQEAVGGPPMFNGVKLVIVKPCSST